jgi:hypothetical protein
MWFVESWQTRESVGIVVYFEFVFEQANLVSWNQMLASPVETYVPPFVVHFVSPEGSSLIFFLTGSGIEDLQIIEELDPESIRAQRYLYH